ncbi:MAG TPA: hypothetical protein VHX60_01365 [Acidobacteriaceae bacterium]|jgi:hypothetical protein|nr:hypothetical protein [Acidobacteriaceae bacterium]
MNLSYTLRLLCLLTVVAGFVTAALQIILALNARSLLRRLEAAGARRRERILYLLQVAPLLLGLFVAGALCLPEYLLFEPTHETEPVGWICLLLTAAVVLWFGSALLRGLRIALRTLRFTSACRRSGRIVPHASSSLPVRALVDPNPPVCLIGFLHPLVVVSADLLEAGGLNPGALDVALDHERAHAQHRDNWKLLSLCLLPRLHRRFGPSDCWQQHWQKAADWAADDDAVRGDPARSFLLAETLVRAARSVRGSSSSIICTALTSAETGLSARIDRLLRPPQVSRPVGASLSFGLGAAAFLALGAAGIAFPWIYSLSEHILHLGGF